MIIHGAYPLEVGSIVPREVLSPHDMEFHLISIKVIREVSEKDYIKWVEDEGHSHLLSDENIRGPYFYEIETD